MDRPDAFELRVRFGFGLAFGLLMGVLSGPRVTESARIAFVYVVVCGLVCGLLARRYGDRFWAYVTMWPWF